MCVPWVPHPSEVCPGEAYTTESRVLCLMPALPFLTRILYKTDCQGASQRYQTAQSCPDEPREQEKNEKPCQYSCWSWAHSIFKVNELSTLKKFWELSQLVLGKETLKLPLDYHRINSHVINNALRAPCTQHTSFTLIKLLGGGRIPWNLLLRNTYYMVSALHTDEEISRVRASGASGTIG